MALFRYLTKEKDLITPVIAKTINRSKHQYRLVIRYNQLTSLDPLSHFHFANTSFTGWLVKSSNIPSGYWPLNIGNSWVPDIVEFLKNKFMNLV
jgi:hypothetical protein